MLSLAEVFSFLLASMVLAFAPGPDIIFVIVTSLEQGFKTALKFIIGLTTGIVLHTLLLVIGVSTLISQSQYGLLGLQIFAATYLLYLACQTFIHRHDDMQLKRTSNVDNYFLRGFIMNISNPKILLFFLAFFPKFASINQAGYQARLLLLGGLFILVTLIVFSTVAWISAKGSKKFIDNPQYNLWMNWLTIIVFISVSTFFILRGRYPFN